MTPTEPEQRRSAIRAMLLLLIWQMPGKWTLEEFPHDKVLGMSSNTPSGSIAEEMTVEAFFRLLLEFDLMDYYVGMMEMTDGG